jgi:Flp pilus assembly protein TadG
MNKQVIRHRHERGQGLVELALSMPMLAMILAGLMHFGLMMQSQHIITNASRVGARAATQPGGNVGGIQAAVSEYCQRAGLNPGQVTVQVDINTAPTWATVTVAYPFTSPVQGIWAAMGLSGGSMTASQLQATTVMRL